jgi:hypothetical protein
MNPKEKVVEEEELDEEHLEEENLEDEEDYLDNDELDEELSDNDDISVEDEAKMMGWISKDKYHGPEENFVSAEEFVRKGKEELPVMKHTVNKLTRELAEQKRVFDAAQKFQEKAHIRELKKLKEAKLEAVAGGDTEEYERLEKEEDELNDMALPSSEKQVNPNGLTEEDKNIMDTFAENNKWFVENKDLGIEMQAAFTVIESKHPAADLETKLKLSKERVKTLNPEAFGNPNRRKPGNTEGGTPPRNKGSGGKTYADLPDEDKKACDEFVRRGTMTKKKYLKMYDWPEEK